MLEHVKTFKAGIKDNFLEEYLEEETSRCVSKCFFGEAYFIEDTYEGCPDLEEIEKDFNEYRKECNLVVEFEDQHGANVVLIYSYGSGTAWYMFTNVVGAVSFAMRPVNGDLIYLVD